MGLPRLTASSSEAESGQVHELCAVIKYAAARPNLCLPVPITQEETQQDDSVPTPSNDPPLSGEDSMKLSKLMILCTNLEKQGRSYDARICLIYRSHGDGCKCGYASVVLFKSKVPKEKERGRVCDGHESWNNTQAMMEADFKLAQRLQTEEQGEITIEERSRLFVELMNKRKKHFAMLRAEEKRRKTPTNAQNRNQMSTYLKNMGGYKHYQLKSKSKSYEEIQRRTEDELESDKSKKAESSEEKAKGSRKKMLGRKRVGKEQQQESLKKQRIEDDKETNEVEEVEEDDEAELKKHLVIVKDDEIAIDAIPLATKPPVIVEYKLVKEGIMVHYQLIRADGSSKRYSSMIRML
ncbi:hypothetical protein Tco_0150330 [Tanacetum coccineum]